MIVRVSERGTFKRCKRRWDYNSPNRQNLTPIGSPVYLAFGSMIHATLEAWDAEPEKDLLDLFMKQAFEQTEQMKARYLKRIGVPPNSEEIGVLYDHIELGRSMVQAYAEKWGSPTPNGYERVELEQTMLVDVPNVPGAQLQGTLDGLLRHKKSGQFFILERKTYGARPRQDVLDNNDQFLAYMWMVEQLMGEGSCGGMVYDGLWKRKYEGKRKLEDLFLRTVLTRPQAEINGFGEQLRLEVADMMNNPTIYPNRQWLGCYDCPFDELCAAESRQENFEGVKKARYTINDENVEEVISD